MTGKEMYELVKRLFPICRSLTGNGVRETLKIIQEHIPIKIQEVLTGTKVFDWTVPREWNIHDAFIEDESGNKIIDFKRNNLHVVGYSIPVDRWVSLSYLQEHLYSLEDQPDAIPYVTSYYTERWGFCIAHNQRVKLKEGKYRVFIDSSLKEGHLTYGEYIIPGKEEQEVFLSTYICHPSMANNELSGPVVTTFLAKWLSELNHRRYTYRIIFIPETIGSIVYLCHNYDKMKKNIIAGFVVTCVGDDRSFSFLASRQANTLADKVALHVLKHMVRDFKVYSFLDRGSDERQYCSPGIDLPVCSVMRTRYGEYPEYHTSLDNLDLITPSGLLGGYTVLHKCIECIENNETLKVAVLCEPQMGKRGLRPTLSTKNKNIGKEIRNMMNLLAYSDGKHSLIEIAETINVPLWGILETVKKLKEEGLLEVVE